MASVFVAGITMAMMDQVRERQRRTDKAVRQATWDRAAFGHPAELRRIWLGCLERGYVEGPLYRNIIAFWHMPAKDGYAA